MTLIQFGFILPATPDKAQRTTYVADVNRALALISGHFDSFWMIDHLDSGETDMLESFTTLAYFSALHPQLKFGHTVICQSFRSPALVAKMSATLQYLSGGRFLFGIGAGGNAEEHRAYGYDFPPGRVRVEQLEEALQIIKAMWTGKAPTVVGVPTVVGDTTTAGTTSFSGVYYRVNGAACEPKPDPLPPVMVGAFQPKMLRITARYADEWNVSSTRIGKYRRMVADFERACAEVGRDPATVRRSFGCGCTCLPVPGEAERMVRERYTPKDEDDFDFVGTPGQIIEQMRPYIDLGVSSFMLDCGGFPNLTTLEMLVNEVIPGLNR